jgi:hypothetical protein
MTVRRLFVALFAVALFTIAVRETLDPDMWWHLRTGEYILQEGIPRQDVFSFTVPDHAWTTHEWLSQVFMWGVYQVGGLPGLMVVFAALTAVSFFLVYRVSVGRPFLAAFVVLLAAFASAMIWGVRPQIFNTFFIALFVYMVERYRKGKFSGRVLWWLPLLTLLWANFHSGYLLGVVYLAVFTAGEALEIVLRRGSDFDLLTWRQIRGLAGITAVSFFAAAINPNGPELWLYPFFTLGSSAMQVYIAEWHSPDFHNPIFWPFLALGALGVLGWAFSPRRPRFSDLLLFGGTAVAGFISLRNIPLFAIIVPPIVCRALMGWLSVNPHLIAFLQEPVNPARAPRWQLVMNGVVLALAALVSLVWTGTVIARNETAVAEVFPVTAVTYLEESGLAEQRGYNSYNWGGYLIWRGLPVFIDGRADVYGDEFMFFYRQAYDAGEQWAEPLDAYQVDYVLMESGQPLNSLLAVSPDWDEVYRDELSQIFVRVVGSR